MTTPFQSALILDDDASVVKQLSTAMAQLGFSKVDTCELPGEALDKMEHESYDFLIVDMHLPGSAAGTFLQIIDQHALPRVRSTRAVAILGSINPMEIGLLAELGVTAYLNKPLVNVKVVAKLTEIIKEYLDPNSDKSIMTSLKRLWAEGKYEQALNDINERIKATPRNARLHLLAASTHFVLDNDEQAEKTVNALLRAIPNSAPGLTLLAKIMVKKGSYHEALRLLEKAQFVCPLGVERQVLMGELLLEVGKPTVAIDKFRGAMNLCPRLQQAEIGIAKALLETGQTDDAIAYAARDDNGPAALVSFMNLRGVQLVQQQKYVEAIRMYEHALKLVKDPKRVISLKYNVSLAWARAGDRLKAQTNCNQILTIDSKNEKAVRLYQLLNEENWRAAIAKLSNSSQSQSKPKPLISDDVIRNLGQGLLQNTNPWSKKGSRVIRYQGPFQDVKEISDPDLPPAAEPIKT